MNIGGKIYGTVKARKVSQNCNNRRSFCRRSRVFCPDSNHWTGHDTQFFIAGLCFASLAAFYPVCTRIGRNDSFCMENARAMRVISRLIAVCVFVLACGLIALSLLHMMMPIIAIGIPLLIVLFAAISVATGVLARLIEKASALQSDIDLTI